MTEQLDAAQVLAAAQDWARRTFADPARDPAGRTDGPHHGPVAPGDAASCQWCPLCQLIAALRGDRPEVTARVLEAGTVFAAALRAVFDPPPAPADGPPEPASHPRVERIDLGGDTTG